MHIKMVTKIAMIGLVTFGASTLYGYDSHHPDPMAILNGKHSGGHRRVSVRTRPVVKKAPVLIKKEKKSRIQPGRMYHRHKEAKYIIKPEPFNLKSDKKDPELLGPQRTYSDDNMTENITQNKQKRDEKKRDTVMTYGECISLIGQEKFDSYSEKYGGPEGALHRCQIYKRLHG